MKEFKQIEEVEGLVDRIKISGTLDEIAWDTEHMDITDCKKVNTITVKLQFLEEASEETVRATIYKDKEDKTVIVIAATDELSRQYLNQLLSTVISVAHNDSVLNDEVLVEKESIDEYDSVTYLIETIAMIHLIANIIPGE